MKTEVIISIVATLTLIGLALASVMFDIDRNAKTRAAPEQTLNLPGPGERLPDGPA